MKTVIPAITFVYILIQLFQPVSAMTIEEIMTSIDKNRNYGTVTYTGTMEIHVGKEIRTKKMNVAGVGDSKALVEFINPQDRGVKYLKLNKDLWIYFPSEQDMVKISGHLLKEGMMGSDISYEDALESDALMTKYSASIEKEELFDDHECWIVQLDAKVKDAPYYKRRMWVDKESFIVRKEEMFAKSGKLLKESHILETKVIGKRNFPVKVEMINKLRKDSKTVFSMDAIVFDSRLSDDLFTLQNLQR